MSYFEQFFFYIFLLFISSQESDCQTRTMKETFASALHLATMRHLVVVQMSTKLSMYEISCYILLCMIIEMTFFINQFKNPKILCMCKFNTHFPPLAVLIKTFCFVCLIISGLVVCTGLYLLLKRNILLLKFNFK